MPAWARQECQLIMFVTPRIKCGSDITVFAFETVNFASQTINSARETINSAPEVSEFIFHMINCELKPIMSGLHMVIVEAWITNCVLVAVFCRT